MTAAAPAPRRLKHDDAVDVALREAARRAMGGDPADATTRLRAALASGDAESFTRVAAALADQAPFDAGFVAAALARLHGQAVNRLRGIDLRLRARNRALARAARRDSLTGIANRAALDHALATELRRAHRYGHDFSVLFVDVDHFKRVNDSRGHAAGDRVLRELTARITASIRPGDVFGRYGGEEFVIGLVNADARAALRAAERLRSDVEHMTLGDGADPLGVTVSVGIATLNRGEESTIHALVAQANRAMLAAKRLGRNTVCSAGPQPGDDRRVTLAIAPRSRRTAARGRRVRGDGVSGSR